MVEIAPFKGVTYNKEKISQLDDVMSPPYDIIPPRLQDQLYEKHENNFVRIILNKEAETDTESNNRYTRAKAFFDEWAKDNIFTQLDKPALFPYKIHYEIEGKKKIMNGFFCLLKVDPTYKLVKAHEKTLSKPKADRLNMMRVMQGNMEPIQLLYIDDEDDLRKKMDASISTPIIDVQGYDGFRHQLFKIDDSALIEEVTQFLDDEILFIADGHHRYQTAINYAEEMKKKTGNTDSNAPFNYRMVILANMFDEGLSILPTHRFIKKKMDLTQFLQDIRTDFTVEEHTSIHPGNYLDCGEEIMSHLQKREGHVFALYHDAKYWIMTLKNESMMDTLAEDRSKTWRTLDVSILHKAILEKHMGITQDNLEDHVKYTRELDEAIEHVDDGTYDYSFLMNATKIDELKAIADGGEHMPQKSTYFLPKMLSGLVMYKMNL